MHERWQAFERIDGFLILTVVRRQLSERVQGHALNRAVT